MRLRRETGDFQIKGSYDSDSDTIVYNSIRPGLGPEDLIGEIVSVTADGETSYETIVNVLPGSSGSLDLVPFGDSSDVIIYDPSTGAVTGQTGTQGD